MGEPLRRPVQRDPAEEEDGQDEVGEEGGEVNHLESHPGLCLFSFCSRLMAMKANDLT